MILQQTVWCRSKLHIQTASVIDLEGELSVAITCVFGVQ
jgi:hypothetical protein